MPELPLAYPRGTDDLYLARGDDVPMARPVMPGDVFADVEIGVAHDGHVLVVAHPCAMRGARGRLRPRLAAAPVRRYQALRCEQWPERHFNWFPLPELIAGQSRAANLLELGTARSEDLARGRRIACLSHRGVYLLQQRFVHSLARVVVGLDVLERASGHILAEADLEEEWVDELAAPDDLQAIDEQSAAFADFLDHGLREQLQPPESRSDVRRAVRREIARRRSERPPDDSSDTVPCPGRRAGRSYRVRLGALRSNAL